MLSVFCRKIGVLNEVLMHWKGMHVDLELEMSGVCMEVVENRRERYPILLERSKWAQKGPKNEQRVFERYTYSCVALPAR